MDDNNLSPIRQIQIDPRRLIRAIIPKELDLNSEKQVKAFIRDTKREVREYTSSAKLKPEYMVFEFRIPYEDMTVFSAEEAKEKFGIEPEKDEKYFGLPTDDYLDIFKKQVTVGGFFSLIGTMRTEYDREITENTTFIARILYSIKL